MRAHQLVERSQLRVPRHGVLQQQLDLQQPHQARHRFCVAHVSFGRTDCNGYDPLPVHRGECARLCRIA